MLVKVIKDFNDRTADLVTRVVDDELDVTEQRAEELIKGGYVEKVEDDSALNQTPPESDEDPGDSAEEPTEDSAEETTPEPEPKPEPKTKSKAKKNEKKD